MVFDIEDLVPVFNQLSDIEKVIRIGKIVVEFGIIAEQIAGIFKLYFLIILFVYLLQQQNLEIS